MSNQGSNHLLNAAEFRLATMARHQFHDDPLSGRSNGACSKALRPRQYVPSNDPVHRFHDILENISRIEQHTAGMNVASFLRQLKTCDAVERCLERISEASKKLGNLAESLCPGIRWPELRALLSCLASLRSYIVGIEATVVTELESDLLVDK
jgi:uncharacterized protein with HEPN domain